jgi:phosphonate transport system substrate-binding protein
MLKFGTFLAPSVYQVYEFIASYIGRELGEQTTLSVGRSLDQFDNGDIDVGFVCGLPYVYLTRREEPSVELIAAPVLAGERYASAPVYFSDVIVHRESGLQSFADLRKKRWAYNEPMSHSGYNVVRNKLIEMGETSGYFGDVVAAGWHQTAVRMVADRSIDASAIDSQVLEIELRNNPRLNSELKVIDALGPSTIQPVVAAARMSDELRSDIAEIMFRMGEDPDAAKVLRRAFFSRFVPIEDADYDVIRRMLRAAEDAEFMEIK